jgi:hypothetical protein
MASMKHEQPANRSDFAAEAERPPRSFLGELWDFTRFNKKWWLTPLILVLLLLGALIAIGGTSVAPFIYTLF